MRKVFITLISLLFIGTSYASDDDKLYVSVQQNGTTVDAVGTAAFSVSGNPTLEFDDEGNSIVTVNGNKVAQLPIKNGGEMVLDFESSSTNTLSKTVGTSGYATLYSPFQLAIPVGSSVEVYAPTYDQSASTLSLSESTQITPGSVIPVCTGLLLKNAGTVDFTFSESSPVSCSSALSGSSLKIDKPELSEGQTIYTLGHETSDNSRYGFFVYTGSTLAAGKAYLVAAEQSEAKAIYFVSDETNAVEEIENRNVENAVNYNLLGQRVNGKVKGIVIRNGKKYNNR